MTKKMFFQIAIFAIGIEKNTLLCPQALTWISCKSGILPWILLKFQLKVALVITFHMTAR
jgi:hypothetical protein